MQKISKELVFVIQNLQQLFYRRYDETKRILISTEEFGSYSNEEVFYNLFNILDQIHQIFLDPSLENLSQKLNIIEANFLVAQNYALVTGLIGLEGRIKEILPHHTEEIAEIVRKVKGLLIETNLLKIDEETKEPVYDDLKDIGLVVKRRKETECINQMLKEDFIKAVRIFLPKWELGKNHSFELKPLNENIYEKLVWVIRSEYESAKYILFHIFSLEGTHYNYAVQELRDAVDHIATSLLSRECDPVTELSYASEHIRRAAMETIQFYINKKLDTISELLSGKTISQNMICDLMEIESLLCCARYHKASGTWYEAVEIFLYILKKIDELEKHVGES